MNDYTIFLRTISNTCTLWCYRRFPKIMIWHAFSSNTCFFYISFPPGLGLSMHVLPYFMFSFLSLTAWQNFKNEIHLFMCSHGNEKKIRSTHHDQMERNNFLSYSYLDKSFHWQPLYIPDRGKHTGNFPAHWDSGKCTRCLHFGHIHQYLELVH